MNRKVKEVITGDIFKISPEWVFDNKTGDTVLISGYKHPEQVSPGDNSAKDRLTELISGKEVELRDMVMITRGRLLCDVYFKGKNIADYFPEYK